MIAINPIITKPIEPHAGGYTVGTDPGAQVELVISNLVSLLTLVAGLAFLIYFFLGALNLLTSGGDQQKTQIARQYLLNAIIGLVITVSAYAVAYVISNLLGIDITRPSTVLNNLIFK
jgi:predicted secreted protein